jgi:hypothetical protein
MKNTALLTLVFVGISWPVMAKPHYESHHYGYQHARYEGHHYGYERARYEGHHYGYEHARYEGHHYGYHHVRYEGRHYGYHDRAHKDGAREAGAHERGAAERHSHITCEMVRSYVAQVGLAQAKAMAQAAGMTPSEERRAKQCLSHRV